MGKVFVSHAFADKVFVDEFVDTILFRGLGLSSKSIFYSSERDTGVPSGADLMNHVRQEVSDTTLVVAIVSPTYQTRPVCIAEFGAAWGRADPDFTFPFLTPGVERSDLQGVLASLLTLPIGDEAALDELSDRIRVKWETDVSNTQWGVGKRKWLAALKAAAPLALPDIPTPEQYQAVLSERDELTVALDEAAEELRDWKLKFAQLEQLKDAKAARVIRAGGASKDRFTDLISVARQALSGLNFTVRDALYYSLRREIVRQPSYFDDPEGVREFQDAVERNMLSERSDGDYVPNPKKRPVGQALEAIEELRTFLESVDDSDFYEWFDVEYPNITPDVKDRDAWENLLVQ